MRVLLLVEMDFGLSFKNFKSLLVTSCRLMFLLYSQIYVYTYAYAYMPIIFLYFSQKKNCEFSSSKTSAKQAELESDVLRILYICNLLESFLKRFSLPNLAIFYVLMILIA